MINQQLGDVKKKLEKGEDVLTKFLDLEEQGEIMGLANPNLYISFYGGATSNERVRAYLSYVKTDDIDYEIAIIQAQYDAKFANINHRHVLGTIMSLGIERNTFGDIIVTDTNITIFVSNNIKDYLINNLNMINHIRLNFKEISNYDILKEEDKEKIINVPSLRLDAVIAKACNKSREEAVEIINNGNVFINYKNCEKITYNVQINDILSIRHYGRIIIKEELGLSKKNRINLKIIIKH